MLNRCFAALAALVVVTLNASAATIVVNEGAVSVSRGQGFEPAGNGTPVAPGDKVLVATGGSATIVFSAECQVPVGSGQVVTIPVDSPCFTTTTSTSEPLGTPVTTYVIGGLAVAGAVGIAVGLSGGGGGGHSP